MRYTIIGAAIIIIGLFIFIPISAQENPEAICPATIQSAFETTLAACDQLGANQACYGNPTIVPRLLADVPFSLPGDTADLTIVGSLSTSTEDNTWGVIPLRTQAYPHDSWLAQEVAITLFGNVQLDNAGNEGITLTTLDLEIDASAGANVRVQPSTEFRIVQQLLKGEIIKVTGRLADNNWVRVQVPPQFAADRDHSGWVTRGALAVSDDMLAVLPVVIVESPIPEAIYPPLAALQFQSGIDDALCATAPDSGLLIQTVTDAEALQLQINRVNLTLNGTAFLQGQPERTLIIHVLEGVAEFELFDVQQTIVAGTRTQIPLDATLTPSEVPNQPQRYNYDRLATLPLIMLPRRIAIGVLLDDIIITAPVDGSDPLARLDANSICTVAAVGVVNLRSGPGTEFPVIGEMQPRQSAQPKGRFRTSETDRWWFLDPGVWVSWQAVFFEGDCETVPEVEVFSLSDN